MVLEDEGETQSQAILIQLHSPRDVQKVKGGE